MTVMLERSAKSAPRAQGADVVVGVGSSAGGLEAMLTLFRHVRPNRRVAYVVAQHMAHDAHTELFVRIIQRDSALPVVLARHRMNLEADRIYVIPADHDGAVIGGQLHLLPPDPQRASTPSVDVLMRSLADNLAERGWAIVLSGAGWDGAQGCRAVAKAGGPVLVQDAAEAGFSGMPDAVIEHGVSAVRMPATQMGAWIDRRLAQGGQSAAPRPEPAPSPAARERSLAPLSTVVGAPAPDMPEDMAAVIDRVKAVTGIDFAGYREETLLRRLGARRRHLGIDAMAYRTRLARDPREVRLLQHLFLVSLSSFWRDRECFDALILHLGAYLASKPRAEPIRVWVPGCASGEEVYTLAALLGDLEAATGTGRSVQVIGTDLNPDALDTARAAQYPSKAFREAPAGWVERHCEPVPGGFRIGPELASRVQFEQCDVDAGVPAALQAGDVDLVSCRNLLIYFKPPKQDRLLLEFQNALRPHGLLFIGPSESLSPASQTAFRPLDAACRVFARRG